jgi:hypothetical protein
MARNTFDSTDRLLIDGNNLLHRMHGAVDTGAVRLLLVKLQTAIPPTIQTTLMLDGHPASGTERRQQVTKSLTIQHAGSLSAYDALLNLVRDQAAYDRHATTIVTDDRSLADRVRALGARTQRLDWLEQLLKAGGAGKSTGIGNRRPPKPG